MSSEDRAARPGRTPALLLLLVGGVLGIGALAMRVEAGNVAQEGGKLEISAPLRFVVDHLAMPILHGSGTKDPAPAQVADTLSLVLWTACGLGVLVAAIGAWRLRGRAA